MICTIFILIIFIVIMCFNKKEYFITKPSDKFKWEKRYPSLATNRYSYNDSINEKKYKTYMGYEYNTNASLLVDLPKNINYVGGKFPIYTGNINDDFINNTSIYKMVSNNEKCYPMTIDNPTFYDNLDKIQ